MRLHLAGLLRAGGQAVSGKYRTIVVDPPWPVAKIERKARPKQGASLDYKVQKLDWIRSIPVGGWADPGGCHVYLWVTHRFLPAGLEILAGWGARYECTMTWVKPSGMTPFSWMYNTEHVLFGRIGNLPLDRKGLKLSFGSTGRLSHSSKPDSFYDMVEMASPEPRLEVFARRARLGGWDYWGDQSLGTAQLPTAKDAA